MNQGLVKQLLEYDLEVYNEETMESVGIMVNPTPDEMKEYFIKDMRLNGKSSYLRSVIINNGDLWISISTLEHNQLAAYARIHQINIYAFVSAFYINVIVAPDVDEKELIKIGFYKKNPNWNLEPEVSQWKQLNEPRNN